MSFTRNEIEISKRIAQEIKSTQIILKRIEQEMQLVKDTEYPNDFKPFTVWDDMGLQIVTDNYTEDNYPVTAETVIDLLKQIHGLA